jgi:enamine deaminase RidA (YjgF/YER057c/UK114 family)
MEPRMESAHDAAFARISAELGYDFSGEIKIGGNCVPYVVNGAEVYVSGQIPRVGDKVVATGRAGADVSLSQAQLAAKVCAMRASVQPQHLPAALLRDLSQPRVGVDRDRLVHRFE